jgi:hypothetical protein
VICIWDQINDLLLLLLCADFYFAAEPFEPVFLNQGSADLILTVKIVQIDGMHKIWKI